MITVSFQTKNCSFFVPLLHILKQTLKNHIEFLNIRYNKKPEINARKPFTQPNSLDNSSDSCSQEKTANIIPKAEMNNQISFFTLFFILN